MNFSSAEPSSIASAVARNFGSWGGGRARQLPFGHNLTHFLPGVAPVQQLIGANADTAVAVVGMSAYPMGVEITLEIRLRHGSGPGWEPTLPGGWEHAASMIVPFAVRFADGRTASSMPWPREFAWPAPGRDGVGLVVSGREVPDPEAGLRAVVRYWLAPLPPPGPLTLLAAFPARGLQICETVVDAALVRAAAERAVVLWPDGLALPRPGVPPADPETAAEQIRAAFTTAFTGGQGGSDPDAEAAATTATLAAIEGGEALRPLLERVRSEHPDIVRTARPSIDDIVFIDPGHAAVRFRVHLANGPDFGEQIGFAVLTDSAAGERAAWKVAARTYRKVVGWGGVY
ncbi:hypothetical protein CcI49_00105 [Frankia sp. CcI49]|uniref:hypothetical protein n=1 Tax=Frankia sp. CcI49 TaxID=1745382 RepID=UPI00097688B9|nr:hypothetical protein [Frankia sp. CcI49]ONH62518.1 hypothetical protein CcI49_00105 [Frankia sp. CcI49]